jgi:hypothetical protein
MSRRLFFHIVDRVTLHDSYFQQRTDATGLLGLSPLQKCTAAIRQLCYGVTADAVSDCGILFCIFNVSCLFMYNSLTKTCELQNQPLARVLRGCKLCMNSLR